MDYTVLCIISFVLSFFIAFGMTPVAKKFAFKVGAIAKPRKRDMHKKPIPRMGGIAIVAGFMFTLYLTLPFMPGMLNWKQIFGITLGLLIIFLLGLFDDIYELSAKLKLVVQILAAAIVAFCGVRVEALNIPFFANVILNALSIPFTIFWIVGITNAVNFIDGLDGLAAGISSIASICLMLLSIYSGYPLAVLLTAALAGSCLGFLPYNFNPASIFMGDTGSTFLGFTLGVTSILGLLKSYTLVTILIAVLVLGLPIFDTSFAIIRRLLAGKSIMSPDRGHLHHRLVDKGYSQKRAVITLYGISGIFGLSALALVKHDLKLVLAVFFIMGLLFYFNVKKFNTTSDQNQDN